MDKEAERAAALKAWQEPHGWGYSQVNLGTETSPFSQLFRNLVSDRQQLPVGGSIKSANPPSPQGVSWIML